MHFPGIRNAPDADARFWIIDAVLSEHLWEDELQDFGLDGYADDANHEDLVVDESDPDEIVAKANITFVDSVPSGCKDYNHNTDKWAPVTIQIDRESEYGEIEFPEGWNEDTDDNGDHLFPKDYQ